MYTAKNEVGREICSVVWAYFDLLGHPVALVFRPKDFGLGSVAGALTNLRAQAPAFKHGVSEL